MTMDPTRLWAKSKRGAEPERPSMFLPGHLADVHAAAIRVLDATADDQLAALGLNVPDYKERLRRCVLLAAAVHDLGKANDHFQGMLLRTNARRDRPQGLRHEWVSLLMMQQLRDWLLPVVGRSETDFAVVEWAVAGHHPGHNHASPPKGPPQEGGAGAELTLLMGHKDYQTSLAWLRITFKLGTPPALTDIKREMVGSKAVFSDIVAWAKRARKLWEPLSENDKRLVAAVKNALVAADIAGSALPRDGCTTYDNAPRQCRRASPTFRGFSAWSLEI